MDIKYLIAMIIGITVFGLVLVMMSTLGENNRDTLCGTWNGQNCSTGVSNVTYTIANDNLTGLNTASGYQGFLVTIGILVVIVGALVGLTRMFA